MSRLTIRRPKRFLMRLGVLLPFANGDMPVHAQARDSAGIMIVDNAFPLPRAMQRWHLAQQPSFAIGGGIPDGPYDLRNFQVLRTGSGRLMVSNASTFNIRIYDSLGRHITSVGRHGEGPNEFRALHMVPAGDNAVAVLDRILGRVTWVHESGRMGPTVPYSLKASRKGQSRQLLAVLRGREAVSVERTFWSFSGNTRVRDTTFFLRGTIGGETQSVIASAAGVEIRPSPTRPGVLSPVMYGRTEVHAVGGDHLFLARNDKWEIEVMTLAGSLRRLIRLRAPAERISPARERQMRAAEMAAAATQDRARRESYEAEVEARPYATSFPPIDKLFVAQGQTLFVLAGGDPTAARTLDIFSASGEYQARLKLPEGFRLLSVSENLLIGEIRDADDIQHLVGYPILRGVQ